MHFLRGVTMEEKKMSKTCSKCGYICDSYDFDFCPKCGQKMELNSWSCKACGTINPLDACFCIKCGQEKEKIVDIEKDNQLPKFKENNEFINDKTDTVNKSESFVDANRKIISAIIIVVMLLGGFILYQNKHNINSNFDNTSSVTTNDVYHSEEFKIKKSSLPLYVSKYRTYVADDNKLSDYKRIHDLYYKVPINYPILKSEPDIVSFGKNESDSISIISFQMDPVPDNEIGDCYLADLDNLVKRFKEELKKHNEIIFYIDDYYRNVNNNDIIFLHGIAFVPDQNMRYYKEDLYMTYYKKYGYCIEVLEGTDVFSQNPDRHESYDFLMSLKFK